MPLGVQRAYRRGGNRLGQGLGQALMVFGDQWGSQIRRKKELEEEKRRRKDDLAAQIIGNMYRYIAEADSPEEVDIAQSYGRQMGGHYGLDIPGLGGESPGEPSAGAPGAAAPGGGSSPALGGDAVEGPGTGGLMVSPPVAPPPSYGETGFDPQSDFMTAADARKQQLLRQARQEAQESFLRWAQDKHPEIIRQAGQTFEEVDPGVVESVAEAQARALEQRRKAELMATRQQERSRGRIRNRLGLKGERQQKEEGVGRYYEHPSQKRLREAQARDLEARAARLENPPEAGGVNYWANLAENAPSAFADAVRPEYLGQAARAVQGGQPIPDEWLARESVPLSQLRQMAEQSATELAYGQEEMEPMHYSQALLSYTRALAPDKIAQVAAAEEDRWYREWTSALPEGLDPAEADIEAELQGQPEALAAFRWWLRLGQLLGGFQGSGG